MSTNTGGGTTTSLNNTPQATGDLFTRDEDCVAMLDVMSNDLGGSAKILWSVDDGSSSLDLIASDIGKVAATSSDRSVNGAKIWIQDGKVAYDAGSLDSAFKARLQALNPDQSATDTFTYAIRLSNGTLSWNTVTVLYLGRNDAPVAFNDSNGADLVVEAGVGPGNLTCPHRVDRLVC